MLQNFQETTKKAMCRLPTKLAVLGSLLLLALIGCSSEPEYPALDPCDGPGVRNCFATIVADIPDINAVGRNYGRHYALSDTLDEFYKGARLVLSYDSTANAFIGTLVNTTSDSLPKARVEIRLDGSADRSAHIALVDLAPSQVREVTLHVDGEPFIFWQALTDVESLNRIHGHPSTHTTAL